MSANTDRGHQRLHAVAGRWATSGHVLGDPPVPVVGTDTYEVLDGGYFLVHHVDVTVGALPVRAIEIIGEPDPDTPGSYLARAFDKDGATEVMHLTIDDEGVFHFAGGPRVAPAAQRSDEPTTRVRSMLTLADDGASMTAVWQRADEDGAWQPWMHITFRPAPS